MRVIALEGVSNAQFGTLMNSSTGGDFLDRWGDCGSEVLQKTPQFRVVIWDPGRWQLTCARDATSSQALYYTVTDGVLAFASEVNVLIGIAQRRLIPDNRTIALHLANRIFDESATLFENVFRLPPGCTLVANQNGIKVGRRSDFNPAAEVWRASDDEYAGEFLQLLRTALDDSIAETAPPGLLLSGGLDSSAIACAAHDAGHRLKFFSLVSARQSFDESRYVREIASETHTTVTEVSYECEVEPFLSLQSWDNATVLYSPMMRFCEALFRIAKVSGTTVLLTGFGGDELFSSNQQYLSDLVRAGAIQRAWRQAQSDANVWGSTAWRTLWLDGIRPLLPTLIRRRCGNRPNTFPKFVSREFLESSGALHFIESSVAPDFKEPERRQIFWALRYGWNIVFQLEQIETLAAQYGLELRHPFLDNRLVQYVIALPNNQRHRAEGDRYILRNSMRSVMPETIRTRTGKSDLAGVIDRELRTKQAKKVQTLLSCSKLAELAAVDRDELISSFDHFLNGSREIHASYFEIVVGLELWLRKIEAL